MQTWIKVVDQIRSPLRMTMFVLAGVFLAESIIEASGPRSRSVQSRSASGWSGIDLRPQQSDDDVAVSEEESPEAETYAEQEAEIGSSPQHEVETVAMPGPQTAPAPELPGNETLRSRSSESQAWFQLQPRERRSRQYNTLRAPAPIKSPLEQRNPARPSVRHAITTNDRPRSAPSISEFQTVLAQIKAEEEAAKEAEEQDRAQDHNEGPTSRPPSRNERIASTGSENPPRGSTSSVVDSILDAANLLAPYRSIIRNDQLFMDEPLATIRLNEILYYLESGDNAQVIRLAPGTQSNPYFNPPVSSEFQRSRAVYEQVFRSNVQTR